jgi:hypothetical protein
VNMDCKHFDSVLEDLERDTAMTAGVRNQALQHAEGCAYCRARLAAYRVLSLELRALAKEDEKLQAPPHVEASLLAAIREKNRRRSHAWRRVSWAGAAAAIALGSWLVAEHPWRSSGSNPPTKIQVARSTAVPKVASAEVSLKSQDESSERRAPRKRYDQVVGRAAAETANEFIALAGSSYPMGEGMVVRVELPRSAPALVGLPIAGGDASSTITADVVLGQDGVARAIRFVPLDEGKAANQNSGFKQN